MPTIFNQKNEDVSDFSFEISELVFPFRNSLLISELNPFRVVGRKHAPGGFPLG